MLIFAHIFHTIDLVFREILILYDHILNFQAEKVSMSAYISKWYEAGWGGGKVGRMILILQQKAQRPLHLTAGKFAPMSNALFVSVRMSF